jgi:hypothetical protein
MDREPSWPSSSLFISTLPPEHLTYWHCHHCCQANPFYSPRYIGTVRIVFLEHLSDEVEEEWGMY